MGEPSWTAVVKGSSGRVTLGITSMRIASCLGGEAWLEMEVERAPSALSAMDIGRPVTLSWGEDTQLGDFEVVGYGLGAAEGREVFRTRRRGSDSRGSDNRGGRTGAHWVIWQRRDEQESAWQFIERLAEGLPFAPGNHTSDGWLGRIATAFPVGWCFATPGTLPPRARLTRALDSLVGRGGVVAGVVRTVAADEYRLAGIYTDKESAQQRQELAGEHWSLPRCIGGEGHIASEIRWAVDKPTDLALRLFEKERRTLTNDGEEGHPVPVAPGTIMLNKRPWFATTVTTTVQFDPAGAFARQEGTNVVTRLELLDLSVAALGRYQPQTTTLVGEVVGQEQESPFMVGIGPPKGQFDDAWFQPLADWSLQGTTGPLWALQASPGFVRQSASAFYAHWEHGDLVLFDVSDGGPAIIRGAPRRRLAAGALRAKGVALAAGARGDGPRSFLEIDPDGVMRVVAREVDMDREPGAKS